MGLELGFELALALLGFGFVELGMATNGAKGLTEVTSHDGVADAVGDGDGDDPYGGDEDESPDKALVVISSESDMLVESRSCSRFSSSVGRASTMPKSEPHVTDTRRGSEGSFARLCTCTGTAEPCVLPIPS